MSVTSVPPTPIRSGSFSDGNFQSLRELSLTGVITHLPWKNLSNLTTFYLRRIPEGRVTISQLLNFFENAPLLHKIKKCYNLPSILPLNPNKNPPNLVVCPKLKDLVLYIQERNWFHLMEMLSMAEGRALRNAKLSSITIVGFGKLVLGKDAFKLREHVGRVDYGVNDASPDWDDHPSESGDETE